MVILRDLRKKVAKKLGVPPFVVFQDPSLEDMSLKYPISMDEMSNIHGVGEGKAKKYGKEFVDVIKNYVEENDILRPDDLVVNICTEKQLTNMRASGTDDKMRIVPKINFSLEEAMEYIQGDEYVEITPSFIRLRKIYLDENERKRMGKTLVSK